MKKKFLSEWVSILLIFVFSVNSIISLFLYLNEQNTSNFVRLLLYLIALFIYIILLITIKLHSNNKYILIYDNCFELYGKNIFDSKILSEKKTNKYSKFGLKNVVEKKCEFSYDKLIITFGLIEIDSSRKLMIIYKIKNMNDDFYKTYLESIENAKLHYYANNEVEPLKGEYFFFKNKRNAYQIEEKNKKYYVNKYRHYVPIEIYIKNIVDSKPSWVRIRDSHEGLDFFDSYEKAEEYVSHLMGRNIVVEEDWRLSQGDFDYIKNHVFKKQYFKSNKNNDHDHCNFCWKKITDLEIDEEHDTFGYVTLNAHGQEEWVCEKCFNDFKDRFNFKVEDNNSVEKLVRYISKHDRKYYTMMLEILLSLDIPDDYKWLITDVEACPKDDEVSDKLEKPLVISNKELVEMLKKDDFQWIWAVFSLFKPNVENNKIMQENPMLYSLIESKFYETPVIQHSLAILEIDAFDSSYIMITSKEAIYLEKFKKLFPQSIRQGEGDNYV